MNRRKFIQQYIIISSGTVIVQVQAVQMPVDKDNAGKKYLAGAHVWIYASTMPGYDVSPILSQIFSDVAYAGFDGVETMEHPLRSTFIPNRLKN